MSTCRRYPHEKDEPERASPDLEEYGVEMKGGGGGGRGEKNKKER